MAIKTLAAASVVLLLTACGPSAVQLRNPTTGQTTQCGPYNIVGQGPNAADAAAMIQARCLDDYRAQGFVRVP